MILNTFPRVIAGKYTITDLRHFLGTKYGKGKLICVKFLVHIPDTDIIL